MTMNDLERLSDSIVFSPSYKITVDKKCEITIRQMNWAEESDSLCHRSNEKQIKPNDSLQQQAPKNKRSSL